MAEEQRLQQRFLRRLVGPALHHDHGGLGPGQDHVQVALAPAGRRWDSRRTGRPTRPTRTQPMGPWNGIWDTVRAAEAPDDRQDVRVVLLVGGQHRGDDLDVLVVPVGKQRTDRPVDQPGGQRLLLVRAGPRA